MVSAAARLQSLRVPTIEVDYSKPVESVFLEVALVIWHSFKIRQGVHYHNYRLGSLILIITVVYLLCFLKIQNKKVISTHLTATKQELTSHHSLFLTTSSIVEATK
jgi:hypothetical protein